MGLAAETDGVTEADEAAEAGGEHNGWTTGDGQFHRVGVAVEDESKVVFVCL